MKTASIIALGSTILLLGGIPLPLCFGAEPSPASVGHPPEICFPLEHGMGILQALEQADACKGTLAAADTALEACEDRAEALADRVNEQDSELTRAEQVIKDTRKIGEEAAKGSWWERIKSSATKVGAGILIGIGIAFLL